MRVGSGVRLYLAALNQCAQDLHALGVDVVFGFENREDLLEGHGRAVGRVAGEGVKTLATARMRVEVSRSLAERLRW